MGSLLKVRNEQGQFETFITLQGPRGEQGPVGPNPPGGKTGQVLTKASDRDADFIWSDAADPNAIVGDGSIKSIVECSWEDYKQLEYNNLLKQDTEYHIGDGDNGPVVGITEAAIYNIVDTAIDEKLSEEGAISYLPLSGGSVYGDTTFTGWLSSANNNFTQAGNEINLVGNSYNMGSLYVNYRGAASETPITDYRFCNGNSTGMSGVALKAHYYFKGSDGSIPVPGSFVQSSQPTAQQVGDIWFVI